MVGVGVLMLAVAWAGAFLLARRGAERMPRPVLWAMVGMTFSGWVATLAGWYTTEIGRQPWLVSGVLTTEAAVGPVPAAMVAASLPAYLALYAFLLAAYIGALFHLAGKAGKQPPRTGLGNPAPVAIPGE
jgi:cytochrome d ubiquinol oxidase subunit I